MLALVVYWLGQDSYKVSKVVRFHPGVQILKGKDLSIDSNYYLQYFDQEYSRINLLIQNINSLFVQTKDDYSKLNSALHNLITSMSNQTLDYDSFIDSIQLIKDFMQNAEDYSLSAKTLYDSVVSLTQPDSTIQKDIDGF